MIRRPLLPARELEHVGDAWRYRPLLSHRETSDTIVDRLRSQQSVTVLDDLVARKRVRRRIVIRGLVILAITVRKCERTAGSTVRSPYVALTSAIRERCAGRFRETVRVERKRRDESNSQAGTHRLSRVADRT